MSFLVNAKNCDSFLLDNSSSIMPLTEATWSSGLSFVRCGSSISLLRVSENSKYDDGNISTTNPFKLFKNQSQYYKNVTNDNSADDDFDDSPEEDNLFFGWRMLFSENNLPTSHWREIAQTGLKSLSILEMKSIICDLSSRISNGAFCEIDRELKLFDFSRVGADAMVAVSRTLYPAHSRLSEWNSFLEKMEREIISRGADMRILAGIKGYVKKTNKL